GANYNAAIAGSEPVGILALLYGGTIPASANTDIQQPRSVPWRTTGIRPPIFGQQDCRITFSGHSRSSSSSDWVVRVRTPRITLYRCTPHADTRMAWASMHRGR